MIAKMKTAPNTVKAVGIYPKKDVVPVVTLLMTAFVLFAPTELAANKLLFCRIPNARNTAITVTARINKVTMTPETVSRPKIPLFVIEKGFLFSEERGLMVCIVLIYLNLLSRLYIPRVD